MARAWRWMAAIGLFVALVVWVGRSVGWSAVFAALGHLSTADLLAIGGLTSIGYLARAMRLRSYFADAIGGSFGRCLRVMVLHNAANNLLPMRSGELSFPILLRREFGIDATRSVTALLWLRLLDLLALLGVAAATLGAQRWGTAPAVALALVFALVPWPLRALVGRWVADADGGRRAALARGMSASATDLLRTQAWTLAHWLSKLAAYAWVLWRIGETPRSVAVLGAVAGEVTSVLPVHGLAGAGTYEGGIVLVLRPLGVEVEKALVAATDLHLLLLGLSVVLAAVALPFGGRRDPA